MSNERKQTAVDWFFEQVSQVKTIDNDDRNKLFAAYLLSIQMEKEQIEDAWMDGMEGILHKIAAEKYYNETYAKSNEV